MKRIIFTLIALFVCLSTIAQVGQGALKGTVTDEAGQPIPFASVVAKLNGIARGGSSTDFDGRFEIKPLQPGTYEVEITSLGFSPVLITNVKVSSDKTTFLDQKQTVLKNSAVQLNEFTIVENRVKLIERDGAAMTSTTVTSQEIHKMAARSPAALAVTVGGTYSRNDGSANTNIRGSRSDANYYYIDGVKVRGSSAIPQSSIERIGLVQGGIPARYSDEERFYNDGWGVPTLQNRGKGIFDGGLKKTVYTEEESKAARQRRFEHEYPLRHLFEDYEYYAENSFKPALDEPLSTLSIDVDRGSYTNMRRFINDGYLPPLASVRLEEFVNYFPYERLEQDDEHPFIIDTELGECPWNSKHQLLRITMQADELKQDEIAPSNLVFLIDVSGSMQSPRKLELVKRAFHLLTDQLQDEDRVSIVVYAGSSGLVLDGAKGSDKRKIREAIAGLTAGGSTAGGAGIKLAYRVAKKHFMESGNNRVILATDGDFNVGVHSDDELVRLIEEKRETGVFFTTLGFGMGNYKDSKLEKLADHGNGSYAYIDSYAEARKVFLKELQGTLFVVAKDVKYQIEFNPNKVSSYRLLGYENRVLEVQDFDDDTKDAGELGAGHMVTAFYEIVTPGTYADSSLNTSKRYQKTKLSKASNSDELLFLKIRYKLPDQKKSILVQHPVKLEMRDSASLSENFRFGSAVVQFGLLLRDSKYKAESSLSSTLAYANDAIEYDPDGYRREFINLVEMAGEMYAKSE